MERIGTAVLCLRARTLVSLLTLIPRLLGCRSTRMDPEKMAAMMALALKQSQAHAAAVAAAQEVEKKETEAENHIAEVRMTDLVLDMLLPACYL
jgi:hypothetical protein